jgi:hypothetical protein
MRVEIRASAPPSFGGRIAHGEKDYDSTTQALQEISPGNRMQTLIMAALGNLQLVVIHL